MRSTANNNAFVASGRRMGLLALCLALLPALALGFGRQPIEEVRDLHYGSILFQLYQDKYFSALTELLAAEQTKPIRSHGRDPELLKGSLLASYRMDLEAARVLEDLAHRTKDLAISDQAWFHLARLHFRRGHFDEAQSLLFNIQGSLPPDLEAERLNIHTNLLMHGGRYRDAAALLQSAQLQGQWLAYRNYNWGIAELIGGDQYRGVSLLQTLGQGTDDSEESKALRDKTNLALGFYHLRNQDPRSAADALMRMRVRGPFSTKGLLGLGWAHYKQQDYARAAQVWQELTKGAVADLAVLEANLAVPHAMAQLKAYRSAIDGYNRAIVLFAEEQDALDSVRDELMRGTLDVVIEPKSTDAEILWEPSNETLRTYPHLDYFRDLLATNALQSAIRNYHDLYVLRSHIEHWERQVPAFDHMLEARRKAYESKVGSVDEDALAKQINAFNAKRTELARRVERAEQLQDAAAVANEKQRALLDRLSKVESRLRNVGNTQDVSELSRKFELYRGLAVWDVDTTYAANLWQTRKALQTLDQALASAEAKIISLRDAKITAPRGFSGFEARTDSLNKRLAAVQKRFAGLMQRQKAYVTEMLIKEVERRQKALHSYELQAKFALASLHDELSHPVASGR
ncbi:MAG: hypothetical protein AMJ69_13195 [Gammaproteobacteria bacterium SG8_47]|nr:MAG: hypothetical protein AMJ69_13195 [Gammaproteobacteria bacterium SG8_47]